ncbi:hypothetical protein BBP40_008254 [Aspergillus hancockii]|nr:hypothetical protein BBP40_008254 [Aspergillus hancockii]
MPRERDPRTGRFLRCTETVKPAESSVVPGAFETDDREDLPETPEAPEPTETDEATELDTPAEKDETVEINESSIEPRIESTVESSSESIEIFPGGYLEREETPEKDPDRQLQEELIFAMLEESEIPAYTAVTPQKIATFSIKKLDWTNVSSWKA